MIPLYICTMRFILNRLTIAHTCTHSKCTPSYIAQRIPRVKRVHKWIARQGSAAVAFFICTFCFFFCLYTRSEFLRGESRRNATKTRYLRRAAETRPTTFRDCEQLKRRIKQMPQTRSGAGFTVLCSVRMRVFTQKRDREWESDAPQRVEWKLWWVCCLITDLRNHTFKLVINE